MYYSTMDVASNPSLEKLLLRFKAIADEKRLGIVGLLAGGERCVCELQEALGSGQSLLSFHLKTLKDAGLVTDRREGRWVYYSLSREALGDLEDFLRETRTAERAIFGPARACASESTLFHRGAPAHGGGLR